MAGAVEGAHAAVVLGPDDQVLELGVDLVARRQHLGHVPPVHADEVDRAVDAHLDEAIEGGAQELGELGRVISPEAIANSRCLMAPEPPTCPWIGTL